MIKNLKRRGRVRIPVVANGKSAARAKARGGTSMRESRLLGQEWDLSRRQTRKAKFPPGRTNRTKPYNVSLGT